MSEYFGCDDLRAWLQALGFNVAFDGLRSQANVCNWYAYRGSAIAARECECNAGKPLQIVIKPYTYRHDDKTWESAEVEVCGEAGGVWYKLCAYSLPHDVLMAGLPEIEASLVAAWNALRPAK